MLPSNHLAFPNAKRLQQSVEAATMQGRYIYFPAVVGLMTRRAFAEEITLNSRGLGVPLESRGPAMFEFHLMLPCRRTICEMLERSTALADLVHHSTRYTHSQSPSPPRTLRSDPTNPDSWAALCTAAPCPLADCK